MKDRSCAPVVSVVVMFVMGKIHVSWEEMDKMMREKQ